MDLLEAGGVDLPAEVKAADILTQYAVQARYPGWDEPITPEEYRESLQLAARVLFWAEKALAG
jgi:hypothetical protein